MSLTVTSTYIQPEWHTDYVLQGDPNTTYSLYYMDTYLNDWVLLRQATTDNSGYWEWLDIGSQSNMEILPWKVEGGQAIPDPPDPPPKTCLLLAAGVPWFLIGILRSFRGLLPMFAIEAYYKLSMFILNQG